MTDTKKKDRERDGQGDDQAAWLAPIAVVGLAGWAAVTAVPSWARRARLISVDGTPSPLALLLGCVALAGIVSIGIAAAWAVSQWRASQHAWQHDAVPTIPRWAAETVGAAATAAVAMLVVVVVVPAESWALRPGLVVAAAAAGFPGMYAAVSILRTVTVRALIVQCTAPVLGHARPGAAVLARLRIDRDGHLAHVELHTGPNVGPDVADSIRRRLHPLGPTFRTLTWTMDHRRRRIIGTPKGEA